MKGGEPASSQPDLVRWLDKLSSQRAAEYQRTRSSYDEGWEDAVEYIAVQVKTWHAANARQRVKRVAEYNTRRRAVYAAEKAKRSDKPVRTGNYGKANQYGPIRVCADGSGYCHRYEPKADPKAVR